MYSNEKLTNIQESTNTQTHTRRNVIIWTPVGIIADFHLPVLLMLFFTNFCSLLRMLVKITSIIHVLSRITNHTHAVGIGIFAKQFFMYIPTKPSANLLKHVYQRIKAVC